MKTKKLKIKNKRKRGELSSGQLVLIVIMVISFIVIVWFLLKVYNWNPIVDKEACHESIVFRSSVNFGLIKSSKIVPLKCQTEKICLSMSGNECFQVGKKSKDNSVTSVKLDKDPIKARQQVLDQIIESMRDCHSMLGEGKLLFMPEKTFSKNYCLICNRIVLDNDAMQKVSDITYSELYQALSKKMTPDKKTYLEYLHPDWKDWHSVYQLFKLFKENDKTGALDSMELKDWKMNLSEENGFAIISQIAPAAYWKSFAETGAAVGVTALATTGVGAPVAVSLFAIGAVGGATFWYNSPTGEFEYSPPSVEPYNLQRLQNLNCDSFETAP